MHGNFVEISFQAKFLWKVLKRQEFCQNLFALLLHNTVCSYYEFARERKFIWYCINQNPPLNLLLKARIKSTLLNLIVSFTNSQSAFHIHRGINCAQHKRDGHKRDGHKHDEISEKSLSKGMQHAGLKQWRHTIMRHSLINEIRISHINSITNLFTESTITYWAGAACG